MSKTLSHKGYIGSIEVDLKDSCLFGKVLFVNDVITYQGDSVGELQKAFAEAVDEYIETCEEIGKEPHKPFTGSFNVRIAPNLHRKLAFRAAEERSSINHIVGQAIYSYLDEERKTSAVHNHYVVFSNTTDMLEKSVFQTPKVHFVGKQYRFERAD